MNENEIIQPGYLVEIAVPADVLAEIPEDERRFTAGGDHFLYTAADFYDDPANQGDAVTEPDPDAMPSPGEAYQIIREVFPEELAGDDTDKAFMVLWDLVNAGISRA